MSILRFPEGADHASFKEAVTHDSRDYRQHDRVFGHLGTQYALIPAYVNLIRRITADVHRVAQGVDAGEVTAVRRGAVQVALTAVTV